MLSDLFPKNLYQLLISKFNENEINEIRLRVNKPIVVICNNKSYFLSDSAINISANQAIYADSEMINDIVFKASEFSIYSVNEQIKQGYIIVKGGIRIGLCGEVVFDNNIKTIKNFSSLCIRIPHQIRNVSLPIFNQVLCNNEINNTLIISPPGAGKTTMLRDLIYQFSNHNYPYNIFIADERGEITGGKKDAINLGNFNDAICFLNKKDSILLGIRSMSPDVIVTDELGSKNDFEAIEYAVNCGVKVIATVHAKDIQELKQKPEILKMLENKYFKKIVILSKENGVGTIDSIYRENLTKIYGATIC